MRGKVLSPTRPFKRSRCLHHCTGKRSEKAGAHGRLRLPLQGKMCRDSLFWPASCTGGRGGIATAQRETAQPPKIHNWYLLKETRIPQFELKALVLTHTTCTHARSGESVTGEPREGTSGEHLGQVQTSHVVLGCISVSVKHNGSQVA